MSPHTQTFARKTFPIAAAAAALLMIGCQNQSTAASVIAPLASSEEVRTIGLGASDGLGADILLVLEHSSKSATPVIVHAK